ncbi:MAG: hypothetical protein ACRD63_03490, partial [Pyrinomonadaceae bacterium]
ACEVKLEGVEKLYRSDFADPRLRIDRDGFFRMAIRLPARALQGSTLSSIESISVSAFAKEEISTTRAFAINVKVLKAIFIDSQSLKLRSVKAISQEPVTINAGESKMFSF